MAPSLLDGLVGIAGPKEPNPAAHLSPPDPDGRQAARTLVSYSPSLAQPLSASPALRFWESQPVIRALIRQDFLPATARGGGGVGGKQGQPKVKFHRQGPKENPNPHSSGLQDYTSLTL